jgi:hypothetical protein
MALTPIDEYEAPTAENGIRTSAEPLGEEE